MDGLNAFALEQVMILSAQYYHLEREYNDGKLSWDQYERSWNRILNSLIRFLNDSDI